MLLGVLAKVPSTASHNAASLRRSAGLAVDICSSAASPAIQWGAPTIIVFVRSIKNMSSFMSENNVNPIGPPTVIAVLHVCRSATKIGIREMVLPVLRKKSKESTISTSIVFIVLIYPFQFYQLGKQECRISKHVVARCIARARGWVGSTDCCLPIIHSKR